MPESAVPVSGNVVVAEPAPEVIASAAEVSAAIPVAEAEPTALDFGTSEEELEEEGAAECCSCSKYNSGGASSGSGQAEAAVLSSIQKLGPKDWKKRKLGFSKAFAKLEMARNDQPRTDEEQMVGWQNHLMR